MNTFGEWLQQELDQRNWTQADLARAANISRSGISMIFTQDRQPGPDVCLAISKALKIPPEAVFRKAGLLPEKPEVDERADRLFHLFSQFDPVNDNRVVDLVNVFTELNEVDQEEIIEFARLKQKISEQRSEAERLLAQLESLSPEQEEEVIELFESWLKSRGARRIH